MDEDNSELNLDVLDDDSTEDEDYFEFENSSEVEVRHTDDEFDDSVSDNGDNLDDHEMSMFDTLTDMFPNVGPPYIRQMIMDPPLDHAGGDLLQHLIDHLLLFQHTAPDFIAPSVPTRTAVELINLSVEEENSEVVSLSDSEINETILGEMDIEDSVTSVSENNESALDQTNRRANKIKGDMSEFERANENAVSPSKRMKIDKNDSEEIQQTLARIANAYFRTTISNGVAEVLQMNETKIQTSTNEEDENSIFNAKVEQNDRSKDQQTGLVQINGITEDQDNNVDINVSQFVDVHERSIRQNAEPTVTRKRRDHPVLQANVSREDLMEMIRKSEDEIIDVHQIQILAQIANNSTENDELLSKLLAMEEEEELEKKRKEEESLNEKLFLQLLESEKKDTSSRVEALEKILPDVNPETLRQIVEEHGENEQSLGQVVEQILKDRKYEKRNQYFEKVKLQEKIDQYTTNFNLEDFLKIFPDPFEHFENKERECTFQQEACDFLKSRYKKHPEHQIQEIYVESKHNISLADKELQDTFAIKPNKKSVKIKFDNTPLLQEVAFIQNKDSIKTYLDAVKKKEQEEMKMLKAQNLLLECQCCYDDMRPDDCVECDNNHLFCKKCIIKAANISVSKGQSSVTCLMGCDNEIALSVLRKVLPPITFEVFLNKRQEEEVAAAKLDDLVTCPFCPYSMELAPEIKIFTCENQECMKITCRDCKKLNHLPTKCEDVLDEHKGRLFIEEQMTEAFIRKCHKCGRPFIKVNGCNHITCVCGAQSCYICGRPYGQGGHYQCNENSANFVAKQVQTKKAEAINKVLEDNPDMKIPKL